MDWHDEDSKTVKKINKIIKDTDAHPFTGLGHPEPLKFEKSGLWSRRIDEYKRLVYRVKGNDLEIISCKGHYD
jgi:toxin YoeB